MIRLLSLIFIKNREDTGNTEVRTAYGTLCGIFGIFLNILLFAAKLICGFVSGSIAIIADSFNNLADAGSSIVTLLGFRLANMKPDPEHPFGHGRFEYISGLVVSFAIILMGFELGKESISAVIDPEIVDYPTLSLIILAVSVAVKLYMAFYNRAIGKKISSSAMIATAKDSLNDAISTAVILVIALVSPYIPFAIDGWAGLVVSALILWAGIGSVKDTVSPLLGQRPEKEFVESIQQLVMSYPDVSGIHDLVVHDYGPGRLMISLHVEVPVSMNINDAHDMIDNIEVHLSNELNCHAVIHMDPVDYDDPKTVELRMMVINIVRTVCEGASIHDFRVVYGNTHTNLVFDVLVPYELKYTDSELKEKIQDSVKHTDSKLNCVIHIDKDYTGH
ncbi:MAG: cation transporter [Clostridia bacterium]|nr:cation transporter [Clostridia bacterium]